MGKKGSNPPPPIPPDTQRGISEGVNAPPQPVKPPPPPPPPKKPD